MMSRLHNPICPKQNQSLPDTKCKNIKVKIVISGPITHLIKYLSNNSRRQKMLGVNLLWLVMKNYLSPVSEEEKT